MTPAVSQERIDAVIELLHKHKHKFPTIGLNGLRELEQDIRRSTDIDLAHAAHVIDNEATVCYRRGGKYVANGDLLVAIRNSVNGLRSS